MPAEPTRPRWPLWLAWTLLAAALLHAAAAATRGSDRLGWALVVGQFLLAGSALVLSLRERQREKTRG